MSVAYAAKWRHAAMHVLKKKKKEKNPFADAVGLRAATRGVAALLRYPGYYPVSDKLGCRPESPNPV